MSYNDKQRASDQYSLDEATVDAPQMYYAKQERGHSMEKDDFERGTTPQSLRSPRRESASLDVIHIQQFS